MDLHPQLGILDLCAGIGRLGDAVHDGLARAGLGCRVLAHVERDSAAAAALRLRMEASELDQALIWDDLASLDGAKLRGRVAGVCAGLPCPAFSTAGKRVGNADPRAWGEGFDPDDVATWGPIPHAIRIIAESGPGFVFFENVPGWLNSGAFEPVGRELHGLGYTRQAAVFVAAEDVGYPHGRERAFVLAVFEQWRRWLVEQVGGADRRTTSGRAGEELADGHGQRRQQIGRGASGDEVPDGAARRVGVGATDHHFAGGGCEGVAYGAQRGRGVVGHQALTRRDGHADGGDEVVANAGGAGLERSERRIARDDQRHGPDAHGSAAERGADVGDAEHVPARPRDAGSASESPSGSGRRSGVGAGSVRIPLHPPARGTDLAAVAGVVGGRSAAEADHAHDVRVVLARGSAARCHAAAACRLARGIWRDWATVARLAPSFMPAVESGVPVVVDGHPYSHADLLRIGGNCVVADAAEVAFVELWRELVGGD